LPGAVALGFEALTVAALAPPGTNPKPTALQLALAQRLDMLESGVVKSL
jgi:hypothetical protein